MRVKFSLSIHGEGIGRYRPVRFRGSVRVKKRVRLSFV